MDQEFCNNLYTKYNRLFYKIPLVNCPKGWQEIVEELIEELYTISLQFKDGSIKVCQIKEKLGGLRCSVDYNLPGNQIFEIEQAILKWEKYSYKICTECGSIENIIMAKNCLQNTICVKCKEEHDGI